MSVVGAPTIIKLAGKEASTGDRRNWIHSKLENIWKICEL